MLLELCLCVVIFKTCFFNAQSTSYLGTSRTLSVSHPWPYTRDTSVASQTGWRMFAAADFKLSDVRFNVRWST